MSIFTRGFWTKAFENALVTGAAAFAGSGVFTTTPRAHSWIAAAIAAGMAALYTLVKAVGATQAANSTPDTPVPVTPAPKS